jgi:hypothetical protein
MLSRHTFWTVLVVGSITVPAAALSHLTAGSGNNNGNSNIGSGNGNCNTGNNNGNNTIGNNQGTGPLVTDENRRRQLRKLHEQLRRMPLGQDILKMLPDCK